MILRDGVLDGVGMTFVGAAPVAARAAELGAGHGLDVLVVDPGEVPMLEALDGAWDAIRPASAAMIEAGGGRILLVAPAPGGPEAAAVRSGLENLARTLSVEWARFAVRPVAVLPGTATSSAEVAELVAFLVSPAGGYYSGCAFELGAAAES